MISGENHTIWNNIERYITKLNKYYVNNMLINNLEKKQNNDNYEQTRGKKQQH